LETRSCIQALKEHFRTARTLLQICAIFCFPEIVYWSGSKSLFQDKGMVSTMHDAEKQDFSKTAIDILDVASTKLPEALINSPQLDSQLNSDSNGLLWNTLSVRVALSAPRSN
jgi:hypothetical protein